MAVEGNRQRLQPVEKCPQGQSLRAFLNKIKRERQRVRVLKDRPGLAKWMNLYHPHPSGVVQLNTIIRRKRHLRGFRPERICVRLRTAGQMEGV